MSLITLINKLASKGFKLLDNIEFFIIGIVALFSIFALHEYILATVIITFSSIYNDLSLSSFPAFMIYISFGTLMIVCAVLLIYSPLLLNKIRTKTSKTNNNINDVSSLYIDREPWLAMLICVCELTYLIVFISSITFAHAILILLINIAIVTAIIFAPITRPAGIKKYACYAYGFVLPMWISMIYLIALA